MTVNEAHESVRLLIEDVHLSFGDTKVLEGVNLEIEPGEFFAFLGPSGSGKSTLLRAIAGFGPRPRGRILINGEDVLSMPAWKRNVGMVFQSYALWPHMTVLDNVAYGLRVRKVAAAGRIDPGTTIVAVLTGLGLKDPDTGMSLAIEPLEAAATVAAVRSALGW